MANMVLAEEVTQCLGCPRVDHDLRLLAGVAKPASVTVCEDSHVSPCAGGTLSSSDLAGRLCPVVPAGIPFPVGPVGLYGTQSCLFLNLLARMACKLALLASVGRCPHLTLNLLARMACIWWPWPGWDAVPF